MNLPTAPQSSSQSRKQPNLSSGKKPENPSAKSRISVVFGDPILDAGHTATPNLILNSYARLSISPQEMMFIIHLLQHKWDARDPYPSLGSVASRMGVSLRQVQRYEASLVASGYLLVKPRISKTRGQMSNEYNFAPLIARILALDTPENQAEDQAAIEEIEELPEKRGEKPSATPLTSMSSPGVTVASSEEYSKQTNTIIDQIDRENEKEERGKEEEKEGRHRIAGKSASNARSEEAKISAAHKKQAKQSSHATFLRSDQENQGNTQRGGGMKSLKELLSSGLVIPASELPEERDGLPGPGHSSASKRPANGPRRAGVGKRSAKILRNPDAPYNAPQSLAEPISTNSKRATPSARIAETVKRISQEFGDKRIEANVSQLMGIYHRSGMSESAFEDWLYTVRAEMRERRTRIKKPMAYLYTTLKNRLRL